LVKENKWIIMNPEKVAVIIAGFPQEEALEIAKASNLRGFRVSTVGLTTSDEGSVEVPQIGKINLVNTASSDARTRLDQALCDARKEGLFPIVADMTGNEGHVSLYNQLRVPFVFQSRNEDSRSKAIQETEASKTFALISDQTNKRAAAFDAMLHDWSRRFPGLFSGYKLKATTYGKSGEILSGSLSDLLNKDIGREAFSRTEPSQKSSSGDAVREYTLQNTGSSSTFSFSHSSNDLTESTEGITDSISFLAKRAQEVATPRVFSILDVAEQGISL